MASKSRAFNYNLQLCFFTYIFFYRTTAVAFLCRRETPDYTPENALKVSCCLLKSLGYSCFLLKFQAVFPCVKIKRVATL